MTNDSAAAILPQRALDSKRIPASAVAALFNRSAEYFVKCIKARDNPAYADRNRISRRALSRLPLLGWEKLGNEWVIRQADLLSQIN